MKLYDFPRAPSARRVRMFAAEKGIELDKVIIDLFAREHLGEPFRAVNPWSTSVPVLELDDGTRISESLAICRTLEGLRPEPPLMGIDPIDCGIVAMWERRMELDGFLAVVEWRRNTEPRFAHRALIGPADTEQIPALGERGRRRTERFFRRLDQVVADRDFVAGPRFSVADITAVCTVDFAGIGGLTIPDDCARALTWYERVSARPSAGA